MSSPVVLAIDIGTSNAKAQRWDAHGRAVGAPAKARVPLAADGTADAIALAEVIEALVDKALDQPGAIPAAVALSSAWHGLVGVDANIRPVTSFSSWLDNRAGKEAQDLAARVQDPLDLHRRTGAPLHPSFPPARLLWMSRHEPQAFASTCRWCSLAEFLEARWFGPEAASSLSMASGSGLLDQFRREWDPELLEVLGLPEGVLARPLVEPAAELSPAPGRQGQSLLPLFARRWPALAGVPWLPARGDGAAAVVGSGCLSGDGQRIRAALTVGTSAAIRLVVPWRVRAARPLAPALFAYLLDDRRAVVGVARSNAGSLVSWARRVLWLGEELRGDDFTIDPVEVATKDRFPGGHGLLADASLGGERSPRWPADARGTLAGLRTDTSAWDILQALLEASVVGLADGVDALEAWGGRFTVVLSGGGARSAGWHHLLADALDREVVVSQIDESSSRGAALAAMEKFGWLAEDALGPMDASVAKPDKERAAAFAGLRALSRTVGTEGPAN